MKKCPYCGAEYPDEVRACLIDLHELVDPQAHGSPRRRATRTEVLFRLCGAGLVGLAVAGAALLAAWRQAQFTPLACLEQFSTAQRLIRFQEQIGDFQRKRHALPATLADLFTFEESSISIDTLVRDDWGRPFLYSTNAGQPLVISYGRDGTPGGRGLDWVRL